MKSQEQQELSFARDLEFADRLEDLSWELIRGATIASVAEAVKQLAREMSFFGGSK